MIDFSDLLTKILMVLWGSMVTIPFIAVRVSDNRVKLLWMVTGYYIRFLGLFTVASFLYLLGEQTWKSVLLFLYDGNAWLIYILMPITIIALSFYYIYKMWKELASKIRDNSDKNE
jgi:hypothetical protein